jgi:sugar phosphate isomerase/epimerase
MTSTATTPDPTLDPARVICSTITLRHLPLDRALATIVGLGFTGIDLGALPGVCDHVPYELTPRAVDQVASTVTASGVSVRSVNADVGDLNRPLDANGQAARSTHVDRLIALCTAVGAAGLVLPNGSLRHEPITDLDADLALVADQVTGIAERCAAAGLQLWIEAPHYFRLCYDLDRAGQLISLLPEPVSVICDVSHIVAAGSTPRQFVELAGHRISHVHLRDAEPGYIHHSIGNGRVDFADTIAVLEGIGYAGAYSLELETRDVTDDQRPAAALRAGRYISTLLSAQLARTGPHLPTAPGASTSENPTTEGIRR